MPDEVIDIDQRLKGKRMRQTEELLAILESNPEDEATFVELCRVVEELPSLQRARVQTEIKRRLKLTQSEYAKATKFALESTDEWFSTHGQIAGNFATFLGDAKGAGGHFWKYQDTGIWDQMKLKDAELVIADKYQSSEMCKRGGDYSAIAKLAYQAKIDEEFLSPDKVGVALADGFYRINASQDDIERVEHSPFNNATFLIDVVPEQGEPEMMLQMLSDAFAGHYPDEQIRQVRMLYGMTVFRMMPKLQRAVFCMGKEQSGKSRLMSVLRKMLPASVVSSVSPLAFDREYDRAALAGKVLNAVPEIAKDRPIPGDHFKSITGEDQISAREPYGMTFSFQPIAAQWFNGNFFMSTNDQSGGFWRRWAVVHFANRVPDDKRIEGLDQLIVDKELPQLVNWAMDGVRDYLHNGLFLSPEHHRMLELWKEESNSVLSWLNAPDSGVAVVEDCPVHQRIKASAAYELYAQWCKAVGRKSYSRNNFYSEVEGRHPRHRASDNTYLADLIRDTSKDLGSSDSYKSAIGRGYGY